MATTINSLLQDLCTNMPVIIICILSIISILEVLSTVEVLLTLEEPMTLQVLST